MTTLESNINKMRRISALGHELKRLGNESRALTKLQKAKRTELNSIILALDV